VSVVRERAGLEDALGVTKAERLGFYPGERQRRPVSFQNPRTSGVLDSEDFVTCVLIQPIARGLGGVKCSPLQAGRGADSMTS
jgi:hypothetical protein